MRKTLISLCAAAALAGGAGDAKIPADVQVAPEGAVNSPAAALAEVRKLRAAGSIPAERTAVVSFAPGVYELEETLEVTAAAAPVRLVGAERGGTVFSGGRTLQPFTARPDGVWRCKVPDGLVFEQLWVNGERAERAKSPNRFYHYVLRTAGEEKDPATGRVADMSLRTFYTDPAALACLAKIPPEELAEVAIHVWWAWDAEWQIPLSVDAAKGAVILKKPVGRDFFMWAKWCPRFTIENCRAALDAPGEWFLDRRKGELLYIPREGETLSETKAVAPALKRIAYVHDVKGVSFERIAFEHNGWSVGDGFYAHQSAVFADAALQVRDADEVAFRNCRVAHTADYGLWFGEGARDSSVTHTLFEDLGAGGVRLGSRTWTTNTPPEKVTQRVTVDDNIVFSGGHVFPAGTGVFVTYAKNCRVTHNEICDLYYSGVCCGWRWGYGPTPNRDNEISWNHIRHLGKGVLSDMGFIYTLGDSRGTVNPVMRRLRIVASMPSDREMQDPTPSLMSSTVSTALSPSTVNAAGSLTRIPRERQ